MLSKYHVITNNKKVVIYAYSIDQARNKVMDWLHCPQSAILSIKEL